VCFCRFAPSSARCKSSVKDCIIAFSPKNSDCRMMRNV
jgi:hypothetical protein